MEYTRKKDGKMSNATKDDAKDDEGKPINNTINSLAHFKIPDSTQDMSPTLQGNNIYKGKKS